MKQAKIIFGKIGMLKNDYPNVAREIEIYRDTQNDILCYLHNGSKIKVVANDGELTMNTLIARSFLIDSILLHLI